MHPVVEDCLRRAECETMPSTTCALSWPLFSCPGYFCTAALTGLARHVVGRRPGAAFRALIRPGIFFGVAFLAEMLARHCAARVLEWRAAAVQRKMLLRDVEMDFGRRARPDGASMAVPRELQEVVLVDEEDVELRLWMTKPSLGVTPIWFRHQSRHGWTWTTDLRHWQSVREVVSTGGMTEGLTPVQSNLLLLHRLHLRDMQDRVRRRRPARAPPPPPLALADDLDTHSPPSGFICPIAHTVMADPVVGPSGISYERSALRQWLRTRKTDPCTQRPLELTDVYTNLNLRDSISAWAQAQGDHGGQGGAAPAESPSGGASEASPSIEPKHSCQEMTATSTTEAAGPAAQQGQGARRSARRRPRRHAS